MEIRKAHSLQKEALRRLASKKLMAFTKYQNHQYIISWHHKLMSDKLDLLVKGDIKRLMFFVPPRRGKTELCNLNLSAFALGNNPYEEIMCASYSDSLSSEMNLKVQRIMETQEYNEVFPGINIPSPKSTSRTAKRTSSYFDILHGSQVRGNYKSIGVGGPASGKGFSLGIIDDPIKNYEQAHSEVYRKNIFEWYQSVFRTRMAPNARIVIIQTRWHQDDLCGKLLKLAKEDPNADQWIVVSFPEIKDEYNYDDPRKMGQVLWPERFSLEEANKTKASVGSYTWNSLYQQRPVAAEGNIIKKESIKFYSTLPEFDFKVHSWDLTFKDGKQNDYVVGQVWGRAGKDYYLIHQFRKQASFTETLNMIENAIASYPSYHALLIEEKANGAAVIEVLSKKFSKVIPFNPKTSKEERLHSVSPLFEAGNIFLPSPQTNPWVETLINELVGFPSWSNDDCVDALSQGLIYMEANKASIYTPMMNKPKKDWTKEGEW